MIWNNATIYSIRMLVYLGRVNRRANAEEICEATGVEPNYAIKLLKTLRGAGLVVSHKGYRGGFELADEPKNIGLAQVNRAVNSNAEVPAGVSLINGSSPLLSEDDLIGDIHAHLQDDTDDRFTIGHLVAIAEGA